MGNYDKSQQKNYTRVIGPSPNNWGLAMERYKNWLPQLVEMVKDQVNTQVRARQVESHAFDDSQ